MPSPGPGRPRSLDEIKRREICALVSAGCGIRQAARYVQCAASTIHREAQRDPEFLEKLRRAEMAAQLNPLHAMQQAVATHWRAAAWFLERTDPERFSRRDPRAFGQKQFRALTGDLVDIVYSEIFDPLVSERIVKRIKAAIEYAMHSAWDTRRTQNKLRRAMQLFDDKDRGNMAFDPFGIQDSEIDAIFRRSGPVPSDRPSSAAKAKKPGTSSAGADSPQPADSERPSESSGAILAEFCSGMADEFAKQSAKKARRRGAKWSSFAIENRLSREKQNRRARFSGRVILAPMDSKPRMAKS
jgi:hypothetical protein